RMATRERVVRAINRVVVPAYLAMLRARRDPAGLLMSPRVVDDPYGVYDRLRQRGPVVRTAIGGVVVTGHGEAASVLRDPQFEVMSELASPVPVAVICAILGVPTSEGSRVRRWGYDIAPTLDFAPSPKLVARAEASGAEGGEYFLDLVARRRRDPGEDLLSIL